MISIQFTEKPGEGNTVYTWIFVILDKSNATFVCIVSCNIFIVLYCDRLLESLMSPEVEYTVAIKHFGLLKQCIKRALPTALKKAPKSHQN